MKQTWKKLIGLNRRGYVGKEVWDNEECGGK